MSEKVLTWKSALKRILPVVIAIVAIILIAVIFASVKSSSPNPEISDKDSSYLTIGGYKVSKERLYTYLRKNYGVSELANLVDEELLNYAIAKSGLMELIKEKGKEYRCGENGCNLSGGEKQRISIARALINDPDIIFADEPTGNLDSKSSLDVLETLASLHKEYKKTIIMVTHSLDQIKYGTRHIQIIDGKVISDINLYD